MKTFKLPVRVYYEDTDSGGVVYYANYLKFMERARTEWLRSLGFEQDLLRDQRNLLFAVRTVSLDFKKPARFNDLVDVSSAVTQIGGASVTFSQRVDLRERGGSACSPLGLCAGDIKVVSLSATDFRPIPLPKDLVEELMREH